MSKTYKPFMLVALVGAMLASAAQAGFDPNQTPWQGGWQDQGGGYYQDPYPYAAQPEYPYPDQYQAEPNYPEPPQNYQPPAAQQPQPRPAQPRPPAAQQPRQAQPRQPAAQQPAPRRDVRFMPVRPCHVDPRPPCFNKYQQQPQY